MGLSLQSVTFAGYDIFVHNRTILIIIIPMKKEWMTFLLVLCSIIPAWAQTNRTTSFTVKGQVMDSLANESVPYATLRIVRANNPGQAVKLLACDEDGKFTAVLTAPGSYILFVQFVGKAASQKAFTLTENNRTADLGKLYMSDDMQALGQVTVTAQKPLVKVELDKLTYSLEDDPEAKVNNTLEMLRKVPMITVDGEDNIQLKGSSNFKIYMNGKPSNLLSNNPSEVLKSMPASSVKNIEVITDPGARYDAEGIGGIINIITTQNALQGYTGTVRANAGTTGSFGGGGYLSAKIGKLGITTNYNYSRQNSPGNTSGSVRENFLSDEEHFLNQTGRSKMKGPFQYGYLEASYEIDTLNLLSVGGNLFDGRMKNISELDVNMLNRDNQPVYSYKRNSTSTNTFGSSDLNVDFQHSTRKKDELLTLSYRFSHSPSDNESYTDLFDIIHYTPPAGGYPQEILNDASTTEHTGQFDYTTPVRKGQTLETGLKYILRRNQSETTRRMFSDREGSWEDISNSDSHFRHTQHIYSGYLGYAVSFAKFGAKAGVRAEGTALEVRFVKAPEQNFEADYFDVVPNVTLSYQLGMAKQIRIGYNMRIRRPGISYLNPYVNDTDPQNISYGNPELDSEKSNNVNVNFSAFSQKFNLNASLNYTFVNNAIERYMFIDGDGDRPAVTRSTYGNIGKRQDAGGFLFCSWSPVPLFRIYVNGGLNYIHIKSEMNGRSEMANSGFRGNLFAGGQLSFPQDFRVNVNGGYNSPFIQLQGQGSSFYYTALTLSKDFLKKKLTLSLSGQNPFRKTLEMKSTTSEAGIFSMQSVNRQTTRQFSLSVSYRFGTLKESIKKVRRGITNDDVKSDGSGIQEGGSPQ
jgi:outer membrane receptor protein involved in Fe transport